MANLIGSLFSSSDEQLMWRVKLQDDPQAFASLVRGWQKPIQRLFIRINGDSHRAEDLTPTTFARLFPRRADWEPTGKFSTFLWRIALNLCHDELRKATRRRECSLDALEDDEAMPTPFLAADEPAPDAQADARERGEWVRRALFGLAPHY